MFGKKKMNLNLRAFADLGVEVPDRPLDLSKVMSEEGILHPYIIVTMGRTGSTWLAAALGQIPVINTPNEYFSQEAIKHYGDFSEPQTFENHFRTVLRRYGRSGCFGFKINPRRLNWLSEAIDMQRTFPTDGCGWIEMKRINLVKQAFSYARAKVSGHWHDFAGREEKAEDTAFVSDQFVWQHIIEILEEEEIFRRFTSAYDINPMRITYEEIYDSKDQLLIRVTSHIRDDIDMSSGISSVTDRVTKLKSSGLGDEATFIRRYAGLINYIMTNRDSISCDWVKSQVSKL